MIYLFDTNAISDLINQNQAFFTHFRQVIIENNRLAVCLPVYYELYRGLIWRKQEKKLAALQKIILPQFEMFPFVEDDWLQAARFWSSAVSHGKQINDIDLFVAALAYRLDATIVSSDNDFDALPVKRENWRG